MAEGRLFGLGWKFGTKGSDKTKRDLGCIADETERLDAGMKAASTTARMSKLGAFVESISMKRLGDISDRMDDIARAAGAPEITTNLEQTMLQMSKTTKSIGAGMGLTGKELRKFQAEAHSVAYELDVDVGDVAQAMRYASQVGVDVAKDMGMSWMEMGKATQVYGIEAEKMIEINKSLRDSFDLGSKGAKRAMDATVALAKQFGFGDQALQAMDISMQAIDDQFAKTLAREGPEAVEKTLRSITGLGMVMTNVLGGKPAENIQAAADLFRGLSDAQDEFHQLTVGLAEDVPDFAKKMAAAGLNVETMFELMRKDPARFALDMRRMTVRMEEMAKTGEISTASLDRFHGLMADMPAPFKYLMQVSDRLGPKLDELLTAVVKPAGDASNAMRDMAKSGFTTGRSLEEQLNRIRDRFETTFHRISRPEMRSFVGGMRKGYDEVGRKMSELAAEGGPIGTAIKAFSAFRQGGIGAAIGVLKGPKAPVTAIDVLTDSFVDIAGEAIPAITALGSMGLKFKHLGIPLMPVTKTIGLLNKAMGGVPGKILGILGPIGLLIAGIGAFSGDLGEAFKNIGRKVPEFILKNVFRMENLAEMTTGNLWKVVGKKVWDAFVKAFEWVSDNFGKGMVILWDGLKDGLSWLWGKVVEWWSDPSKSLLDKAKDVGKAIGLALGAGFMLSSAFRGKVFSSFKNVFSGLLGFRKKACMESTEIGQCMGAGVAAAAAPRIGVGVPAVATRAVLARGPTAGMGMEGLYKETIRSKVFDKVSRGFGRVGSALKDVGKRALVAAKPMMRMVGLGVGISALSGSFDPLIEKLGFTKDAASSVGTTIGGVMTGAAVAGPWGALIGGLVGAVSMAITAFKDTGLEAGKMGKTIGGILGKDSPTYAAVADFNAISSQTPELLRVQREQAGLLERVMYNLDGAYRKVIDAQVQMAAGREQMNRMVTGVKAARALFTTKAWDVGGMINLQKVTEAFAFQTDRLGRELPEVAAKVKALQEQQTMGIDVGKQLTREESRLRDMMVNYYQTAAIVAKAAPGQWGKFSMGFRQAESAIQMAAAETKVDVGKMSSYMQEVGKRFERFGIVAEGSMLKVTKSGAEAASEAGEKSWAVDLARYMDQATMSAVMLKESMVGAARVSAMMEEKTPAVARPVVARPEQRMVVDVNMPRDEGTRQLISVLTNGFGEVVNALRDGFGRQERRDPARRTAVARRISDDILAGYS